MKFTPTEKAIMIVIVLLLGIVLYSCHDSLETLPENKYPNGTQMVSTIDSSIVGVYDWQGGKWVFPTVAYKNDKGEIIRIRYRESEWRKK